MGKRKEKKRKKEKKKTGKMKISGQSQIGRIVSTARTEIIFSQNENIPAVDQILGGSQQSWQYVSKSYRSTSRGTRSHWPKQLDAILPKIYICDQTITTSKTSLSRNFSLRSID